MMSDNPAAELPTELPAQHSEFTVQGVKLRLPDFVLTPTIRKVIENGRYEAAEARQIPRFIRQGDRVMEFGGGLGFVSTLASRAAQLDACVVVEANPLLIPVIKDTHELNRVNAVVINGAALSATSGLRAQISADGTLPFYVTPNFWGASLIPTASASETRQIPFLDVDALLGIHRPTVIICDIEGGEIELFDGADLSSVRIVFFEVHKSVIGLRGINRVSRTLEAQGLFYDPDFSVGATVAFSREGD